MPSPRKTTVELRPYQTSAVREVLDAYAAGAKNVVLTAPTGSGKTYIATAVMDALGGGLYGAASLDLQEQYLRDFSETPRIQGHKNYCGSATSSHTERNTTCPRGCGNREGPFIYSAFGLVVHLVDKHGEDVNSPKFMSMCEYAVRKLIARDSAKVNANPWYLLREWEGPAWFDGRRLLVVDEADNMDSVADLAYTRSLVVRTLAKYGWKTPLNHTAHAGVVAGLRAAEKAAFQEYRNYQLDLDAARVRGNKADQRKYSGLMSEALEDFEAIKSITDTADKTSMVVTWDSVKIEVTPVRPGDALSERGWPHVERRLFMSGSIVNPESWARWMGLDMDETAFVSVASTFEPENRQIMIWKDGPRMAGGGYDDWERVERVVEAIKAYRHGRTLVHVQSTAQAQTLAAHFPDAITYQGGDPAGRAQAIRDYLRHENGLLIGQSLKRGVDFKGDACRTNIIAKVPFPALDRKVKSRKDADNTYYIRSTVQEAIQALGRGVRGPDDWCRNYIVDASFTGLERNFPDYMRDALV